MADYTKERLERWGLAKCAYAAAHDIEPHEVDETDGGYSEVCAYISQDWWNTLEPFTEVLGLADDAEYAEILEAVRVLKAAESGAGA